MMEWCWTAASDHHEKVSKSIAKNMTHFIFRHPIHQRFLGSRYMIEGCTGKPNNLLDLRSISSFLDHRYHPLQIRQITKTPRSDKVRVDQLFLKLSFFPSRHNKTLGVMVPQTTDKRTCVPSTCLRNIISRWHYMLITWLWCQEVDRMVMELRVRGPAGQWPEFKTVFQHL